MISATLVDANVYEVIVDGGDVTEESVHTVTLQPEYYSKLCGGTITHEWVIIQSFKFLLERESNTAILKRFDLEEISGYFPEFEAEITARLGYQGS